MASKTDLRNGMRVTAGNGTRYPGKGTVSKVLTKNVDVLLDSGQRVRYDPMYLIPEGVEPNPLEALVGKIGNPLAETVPYVPAPQPGTIVRVKPSVISREPKLNGIWIVCGGQGDKSRLFRINNKDGRYWRVQNVNLIPINATLTEV